MNARMMHINSVKYARRLESFFGLQPDIIPLGAFLFELKWPLSTAEFNYLGQFSPGLKVLSQSRQGCVLRVMPACISWEKLTAGSPFSAALQSFVVRLRSYFSGPVNRCWNLRQKRCLKFDQLPLIMGILNVTPDSFSDGGIYFDHEKALAHALKMEADGADIIDIGGESSRPGATPISAADEMARIVPVIEKIRKESSIVISVDTYKSTVADAALEACADLINDITGTDFDVNMKKTIKKYKCPVVIMHMQGSPQTMQANPVYKDVVDDVCNYLEKKADEIAELNDSMIILDPGIGFGKTVEHNLQLIARLKNFTFAGYPLLVGLSKKSFIGKVLNNTVDERLAGGMTADILAVLNGAEIIRVHDVRAACDARTMLSVISNI